MSNNVHIKMHTEPKVYVKKSNMNGIGKGLFASNKIKKGDFIVKFEGKLHRPNANIESRRSNIYFNDGSILVCPEDDLASFANDCIYFPKKMRKMHETLESNEPFYKKHNKAKLNASIYLAETKTDIMHIYMLKKILKKMKKYLCIMVLHIGFIKRWKRDLHMKKK